MQQQGFDECVAHATAKDGRYDADAYHFLREALDFSLNNRSTKSHQAHVRGPELLAGFRDLALREYGPMAYTVLDCWGVRTSEDVGEMVFNLIDAGAFGKTSDDSKDDFRGVYDFDEAFRAPFRPNRPPSRTPATSRATRRRSPRRRT